MAEGRYADTEAFYRRMLGISQKLFGVESLKSVIVEERLATAVKLQGRYEEAEPLFRHVLAVRENALGAEHSFTAGSMNNLGDLLERERHHSEAEELLRRAISVDAKAIGESNPRIATEASNLGLLMLRQRRYKEAEPLLRRCDSPSLSMKRACRRDIRILPICSAISLCCCRRKADTRKPSLCYAGHCRFDSTAAPSNRRPAWC